MGSATIQTDKRQMPIFRVSDPTQTELLALSCLFCAYEACGVEVGMGVLQAVASMQLEDVGRYCHKDKRTHFVFVDQCSPSQPLNLSTHGFYVWGVDYLAGRMVKTTVSFHVDGYINIPSTAPDPSHQGWASCEGLGDYLAIRENVHVYKAALMREAAGSLFPTFSTYQQLLEYAANHIGVTIEQV